MKTVISFAIIICLGFSGHTAAQTWPNNPAGAQTILDFPFNAIENSVWKFAGGAADLTSDPAAPTSPSGVVRYTYHQGMVDGSAPAKHWMGLPGSRELFVGYTWKASNPWQGNSSNVNKIAFIWQPGPLGDNIIYTSMHGAGSGPFRFLVSLSFRGISNGHVPGTWGDDPGPRGATGSELKPGTWYRIEMYVKISSSETSRDGIVRWWINGQLDGNLTNVNFGQGGFNQFEFSPTWGGNQGDVKRQTDYYYFDHAFVSLPKGDGGFVSPLVITGLSASASPQNGKPYSGTLNANGGKAPYYWAVSAGSLPAGLLLDKITGKIIGTPVAAGRSDFTIKAVDSNVPALVATKSFTMIVSQGTAVLVAPGRQANQPSADNSTIRDFDLLGREISRTMAGGASGVHFQLLNNSGKNTRRIWKGE